MINLLPLEEKKEILREGKYKLLLILGTISLLFLISLSLILFSVKIYISGKAEAQKIIVDLEEERFKVSEVQKLEEEIKLINLNLLKLNSFYKSQPNFTELLEKISKAILKEMYLTNLSLIPTKEENKLQVSFSGYCPTREILLDFKKRLEAEPGFKDIYFPPSNWIKPRDINFSATFKLDL